MKLIFLLIALLLIGFLFSKYLSANNQTDRANEVLSGESIDTIQVPSTPKDLKKFEQDLNSLIQDQAAERNKELEDQLGR